MIRPTKVYKECLAEAEKYVSTFNDEVYAGMGQDKLQEHHVKVYNERNRVLKECIIRSGYKFEEFLPYNE